MKRKLNTDISILQACHDPQLFAPWFTGDSWEAWFAFFTVLFGLELTPEYEQIYRECTGRNDKPAAVFREAWVACGRRAGKSVSAATIAVFLACFVDHSAFLKPGESGVVLLIAPDRRQAKVLLKYVVGFLRNVTFLKKMILFERAESVELSNGISIEVATASHKTSRGFSAIAVIVDEAAFLKSDDSAEPDTELLIALRPALVTIPHSLLLIISSPYARRGELYKNYVKHYGMNSPVLFWKAASRKMNPSLPESVVIEALERDEPAARAEFLAEFRSDVERLISPETVAACTIPGRRELPPTGELHYFAFCDPSGGSSDAMTMAIAHSSNRLSSDSSTPKVVLDLLIERKPPFSPESVVEEFCEVLRRYKLLEVTGDRYGGEWPRERFSKHGIIYRISDKTRSELYLAFVPLLNSIGVELLDIKKLQAELCGLERKTGAGRDSIDHAPGSHDDSANSAAGAVVLAVKNCSSRGIVHVSGGARNHWGDKTGRSF